MKSLIITLLMLAISINISNGTSPEHKIFKSERVAIYKGPIYGEQGADYLFLKRGYKSFDLVWSYRRASNIGHYEIVGDTLKLNKEYLFFSRLAEIDKSEPTFDAIPFLFLIKEDELIDVTNYEDYPTLKDFFEKGKIFKRLGNISE